MILTCSRGHVLDTALPFDAHLQSGMRCPRELSYDRMMGSTYCRRILRVQKVKP